MRRRFPNEWWSSIGFIPGNQAPWRASLKIRTRDRALMFDKAWAIDREAAAWASSYGAPQIMGFNCEAAGYATAIEMRDAFRSIEKQVMGFVDLIIDWGLDGAVRSHDWLAFAIRYNGIGQAPVYARRIARAYKRLTGKPSIETLKIGAHGQSVAALQEKLETAGHQVHVDAAFGPATDRAVRAFQKDAGLTVDGVVGGRTWAAHGKAIPTETKPATQPETTIWDVIALILQSIFGETA